jgi:hypothetical protein
LLIHDAAHALTFQSKTPTYIAGHAIFAKMTAIFLFWLFFRSASARYNFGVQLAIIINGTSALVSICLLCGKFARFQGPHDSASGAQFMLENAAHLPF